MSSGRMLLGRPGWRPAAEPPTLRGEVPPSRPPHRTDHSPSRGSPRGRLPPAGSDGGHTAPAKAQIRRQRAFCTPARVSVRLWEVSPLQVLMGQAALAWVFLTTFARFGEALHLRKPSLRLHAQVSITSVQAIQNFIFFSQRKHSLRPTYDLYCSSLKISNTKIPQFAHGWWKNLTILCHKGDLQSPLDQPSIRIASRGGKLNPKTQGSL